VINNFIKQKEYDAAVTYLTECLGELPIFAIRATTLFARVAKDGEECFKKIHNEKGE